MKKLLHLFLFLFFSFTIVAQPNNSELNLPLFSKKLVMAECQPVYNFSKDLGLLSEMKYEDLQGKGLDKLRGKYKTYTPMVSEMFNPMSLEESVAFEMLTAKSMGIDGFKFTIFINGNKHYIDKFVKIIETYFKVAEQRNIDFKFTLNLMFYKQKNFPASRLKKVATDRLLEMFEKTDHSNYWLKSPDGRVVIFTLRPECISEVGWNAKDINSYLNDPSIIKNIAQEFEDIRLNVREKIAFVYSTPFPENEILTNMILDYFPAVSTTSHQQSRNIEPVRQVCKERNRPFLQEVITDHLGSQLYSKISNKTIRPNSKKAKEINFKDTYTVSQSFKLTATYRDLLNKAVERDASLILLSSWNKYSIGSHISPEVHHGFSYGILLKYYKDLWYNEDPIKNEIAIVSYKQYSINQMGYGGVEIRPTLEFKPLIESDSIEVISILKAPADIYCNGHFLGEGKAGLNVHYAPLEVGEVKVLVKRNKAVILKLNANKEIVESPRRTDWLTNSYSTQDEKLSRAFQNIILDQEMANMRKRFLLDEKQQTKWRLAASTKFTTNIKNIQKYGDRPSKVADLKSKTKSEYREVISTILSEFDYQVWVDMEDEAEKNRGIVDVNAPMQGAVLEEYNILEAN
ncbi:glycoside hydrolase family 71/99 protein [Flammeovirga kamogawensis]|uniref:Uncharacterized protein n=1 Tax=Flammeovirga kamogawensis TaxID=373891 RepID=A0ABX8GQE6_9BACT|nr:hypothetical protein [Flammeovirga kamogawensis]MBB6463093.1 RPA family protein [Flammeovirga kamogawensis]QWG05726.1 hypothetical protein KM029_10055 [Flammeovirga kamogawensis]TRX67555.1 hypothetical protein EO216_05085 [Flammeovirga kamogawensis]